MGKCSNHPQLWTSWVFLIIRSAVKLLTMLTFTLSSLNCSLNTPFWLKAATYISPHYCWSIPADWLFILAWEVSLLTRELKNFTATENNQELTLPSMGQGESCQLYLYYVTGFFSPFLLRKWWGYGCTQRQWQRTLDFCPQFKRGFKITSASFVFINWCCKKETWPWNKLRHPL